MTMARRTGTIAPLDGSAAAVGPGQHFLLNILHKFLNLALHLFHALPHLQNDGHAADIDV